MKQWLPIIVLSIAPFFSLEGQDPLQTKPRQGSGLGTAGIKKEQRLPPSQPVTETSSMFIEYTHSGVITFRDGKWVGAPQLRRLPNRIPIIVEMTLFSGERIEVTDRDIQRAAEDIFSAAGFSTRFAGESVDDEEKDDFSETASFVPLPYFQIQAILYPTADGFVVSLSGRLFEQVQLSRLRLGEGYFFQAITWEKDVLVGLSRTTGKEMFLEQVKAIAKEFVQTANSPE